MGTNRDSACWASSPRSRLRGCFLLDGASVLGRVPKSGTAPNLPWFFRTCHIVCAQPMFVELNRSFQHRGVSQAASVTLTPQAGQHLPGPSFLSLRSLVSLRSTPSLVLSLQGQLVCGEALATPVPYLLAGSHCFMGSWLVKLFRDLVPLDSSRSVFTKSAKNRPRRST